MGNRVYWYKVFWTWLRSWTGFAISLIIMAAFWYLCYWLIATYAPTRLVYFKWGAYCAGCLGLLMLVFNELIVKLSLGARRIRCREDCPDLWDAVAKASPWHFRPRPRIYLIPDLGMNAISFGWGVRFFSAVGATKGAVNNLSGDELTAVMAHEMGHVLNKDILVSTAMAISVMIMAMTGWMLLRLGPFSRSDRSSSDSKKGGGAIVMLVVILVGFLMYGVGRLLGYFLQMFVSRQREYAADARSARIMGSSQPLISALQSIVNNPSIGTRTAAGAFGFMCIADPDETDLLSTHPRIDKRLVALENLER